MHRRLTVIALIVVASPTSLLCQVRGRSDPQLRRPVLSNIGIYWEKRVLPPKKPLAHSELEHVAQIVRELA